MNVLDNAAVNTLMDCFAKGDSYRTAAAKIGVMKRTAQRYYQSWKDAGVKRQLCECGEPPDHRYWCKYRLLRSQKRQGVMQILNPNYQPPNSTYADLDDIEVVLRNRLDENVKEIKHLKEQNCLIRKFLLVK